MADDTIELPTWTDASSITAYLTTIVGLVFAVLAAVHPGYVEPTWVSAALGAAGLVIAGVAQLVNLATHRTAKTAVAVARLTATK